MSCFMASTIFFWSESQWHV